MQPRSLAAWSATLLVAAVAAPAQAGPREETPESSGPLSFSYAAVPISLGVTRFVEIDDLNDSLRKAGLGELDRIMPTVSISLTAAYQSGLLLEPTYRFTIGDTAETTITCHQLLLDAGWLVHGGGDVVAYPLVGIGYGNATLEISLPDVPKTHFDRVLAAPEGEALLSSSAFLVHAGFAASLWGSGHGDFIGLRTGLIWAPVASGWKRRGNAVDGGPGTPMSGVYLAIELGVHSWRR